MLCKHGEVGSIPTLSTRFVVRSKTRRQYTPILRTPRQDRSVINLRRTDLVFERPRFESWSWSSDFGSLAVEHSDAIQKDNEEFMLGWHDGEAASLPLTFEM